MTTNIRPIEFVQRDEQADMLVITNMWPEPSRPVYGVFVHRQVEALRHTGLRIDVLYIRGYLSKSVYVRAILLFLWLSIYRRKRYRLIHVHGGETAIVARSFLVRPMVATYHGDDILGYKSDDGPISRASRLRSLLIRHQAALFSATITQSTEMHDRLPSHVRDHNQVIHCGVDSAFRPMERNDARRQLGWDETERITLFAATKPYEPRKRIDLAEAAVKHAEANLGPIRFVVAENLPLEIVATMMNAADCLLMTSMNEGGPLVVKEAVLCNLPSVATDVGDVRKVLDGVSPSAICKHDANDLGAALTEILKQNRRVEGSQDQRVHFDQTTTVDQLLSLYATVGFTSGHMDVTNPHRTDSVVPKSY